MQQEQQKDSEQIQRQEPENQSHNPNIQNQDQQNNINQGEITQNIQNQNGQQNDQNKTIKKQSNEEILQIELEQEIQQEKQDINQKQSNKNQQIRNYKQDYKENQYENINIQQDNKKEDNFKDQNENEQVDKIEIELENDNNQQNSKNNNNQNNQQDDQEQEQEEDDEEDYDEEEEYEEVMPDTPTSITGSYLDWDDLNRRNLIYDEGNQEDYSSDDSDSNRASKNNKKNSKKNNSSKKQKSNNDQLKVRKIGKSSIQKQSKSKKNQKPTQTKSSNSNNNNNQQQTRKTNILNLPKNAKQDQQLKSKQNSGKKQKQQQQKEQQLEIYTDEEEDMLVIPSTVKQTKSKKQSISKSQKKKEATEKQKVVEQEEKKQKQNQNQEKQNENMIENEAEEEEEEEDAILIDQQSTNMMLTYHTKSPDVIIEFIDKHIIDEDKLFCLREKNIKHQLDEFSYLKERMKGTFKSYYKFKDHNGKYIDYHFIKNLKSSKKSSSSRSKLSSKNQSQQEKSPESIVKEILDDIINKIDNNSFQNEDQNQNLDMENQENEEGQDFDDNLLENIDELQDLLENEELPQNDLNNQSSNNIQQQQQSQESIKNSNKIDLTNKSSDKIEEEEQQEPITITEYKRQQLRYLKLIKFNKYTEEELHFLKQTNNKSIDSLRERGVNNLYATFEDFDKKFRKLMVYVLMFRCKSYNSFIYTLQLFDTYEKNVEKYDIKNKYFEQKSQDLKKLYKEDKQNKIQVSQWPLIPQDKRIYEQIEEYQPVPQDQKEEILGRMQSKKVPTKCESNCVCKNKDYESLGEFSFEEGNWKSDCQNRQNRIECIDCEKCTNQGNLKKLQKKLGEDLREQVCWGIDIFTRKNIFFVLPELAKQQEKINFIEQTLLKAANLIQDKGYDIKQVLDYVIQNSQSKIYEPYEENEEIDEEESNEQESEQENQQSQNNNNNQEKSEFISKKQSSVQEKSIQQNQENNQNIQQQDDSKQYIFSNRDRKFAKQLLKIVNLEIDPEAFRLHTKGVGVVCVNPKGIQKNEFITKYIGEIYSSWRWIERQDIIKKQLQSQNQKDILVDFYNIMFEVHKDDPKGYDLLFVDPILKGNYSSRFSHCCDPNCLNMTTVSNSEYIIGMYAMKNIGYGQELCWDYNSITESKQEHNKAFCLCGSFKCRGKYLALNKNVLKENNQIFENIHDFMQKNIDILKACEHQILTEEENALMEEYAMRENIRQGSPNWLIKWIASILKIIKQENKIFYDELIKDKKDNKNETAYKTYCVNTAFYRTENRIQNLVQSVDRIRYVIQKTKEFLGPFQVLTEEETFGYLYGNYLDNETYFNYKSIKGTQDKSILGYLYEITQKYTIIDKCRQIEEYIKSLNDKILLINNKQFDFKNRLVRLFFLRIAHLLRNTPKTYFHYQGLQLFIYLYAFTHKYYKMHDYKQLTSDKILLSKKELFNAESIHNQDNLLKSDTEESKQYNQQFIVGQMNLWYKQTVQEPEKGFLSDKRGLLQYPNLRSFDHQVLNWPNYQQQQEKPQSKQKINKKEKQQQEFILKQQQLLQQFQKNNNNVNQDMTLQNYNQSQNFSDTGDARSAFLHKLLNNPRTPWNLEGSKWSFANKHKIIGSVFIDQEIYKEQLQNTNIQYKIIDNIDSGYNSQLQLFINLEKKIYGNNNSQQEHKIQSEIQEIQQILIEIENKHNIKFEDKIELNSKNYKLDATEEQLKQLMNKYNERRKKLLQEQQNQKPQDQLNFMQQQQQQQYQQQYQQQQQLNIQNQQYNFNQNQQQPQLRLQQSNYSQSDYQSNEYQEPVLTQQNSSSKKKQKQLGKSVQVQLTQNQNENGENSNKISLVLQKTPTKKELNQENHVPKKRGPKKKEAQVEKNDIIEPIDEEEQKALNYKIKKKVKSQNNNNNNNLQQPNFNNNSNLNLQNENISLNMLESQQRQNNNFTQQQQSYGGQMMRNNQQGNFNKFNNNQNKFMGNNNNNYNNNKNYNNFNNKRMNNMNNNNNFNNINNYKFNNNNIQNNNNFKNNNFNNNFQRQNNNQNQNYNQFNNSNNNYDIYQQQDGSQNYIGNNNFQNNNNFNNQNSQNFNNNFENSNGFNNQNNFYQNNNYQNDYMQFDQYNNDQFQNNNSNSNVYNNQQFQDQYNNQQNNFSNNNNINNNSQFPDNNNNNQQDQPLDDDLIDGIDDNLLNDIQDIIVKNQQPDQQQQQLFNQNQNQQQFPNQNQQNVDDFLEPNQNMINNNTNNNNININTSNNNIDY